MPKEKTSKNTSNNAVTDALLRYTDKIYPSKEVLEKALASGKKLKIYIGVDPTGPHIHLGHATNLLLLRALQEAGHNIIFLIGDFTAQIGDPTDKLSPRQPLTEAQVKENLKTFKEQASKIISFSGNNPVKLEFNSKWLAKMNFSDVLRLAHHITVQQMIERDMFQDRLGAGKPIGVHEFLYPLMQGYDSVAMEVDVEVGGTDQTFNMLVGRTLEKAYLNKEKFVITTPLLVNAGTGRKIMNKSEGGLINLDDSADDMFGKIMTLPDEVMFLVGRLSSDMPLSKIDQMNKAVSNKSMNPRDAKREIAKAIVGLIYGEKTSETAQENFIKLFSKKELPDSLPILKLNNKKLSLSDVVITSGVVKSKSEARRLIEQGAVDVDGKVVRDPGNVLEFSGGEIIKIGKRHFFKIKL